MTADVTTQPINDLKVLLTDELKTVTINFAESTHSEPISCGPFDYTLVIDSWNPGLVVIDKTVNQISIDFSSLEMGKEFFLNFEGILA